MVGQGGMGRGGRDGEMSGGERESRGGEAPGLAPPLLNIISGYAADHIITKYNQYKKIISI